MHAFALFELPQGKTNGMKLVGDSLGTFYMGTKTRLPRPAEVFSSYGSAKSYAWQNDLGCELWVVDITPSAIKSKKRGVILADAIRPLYPDTRFYPGIPRSGNPYEAM